MTARSSPYPTSWEIANFGYLANQRSLGDPDSDGVSNLDEFRAGTNPTNSSSAFFRLTVGTDGGSVELSPTKDSYTNGETVTLTAIPIYLSTFNRWTGASNTLNNPLILIMDGNKAVFAHFYPVDIVWTNLAGGDWNVASNWNPNLVPTAHDNVFITNSVTVSVDSAADCRDLTLGSASSSPALSGSATLKIYRNGVWPQGQMQGSGRTIIAPGALLNVGSGSGVSIEARTLENAGTVFWTGAGNFSINYGVLITNRVGALFEVQNNAAFNYAVGPLCRFDNAGTFRKSIGIGATTFTSPWELNNFGVMEIQTGTLQCNSELHNYGTITLSANSNLRMANGGLATGIFTAPAASLVEWAGGDFTLNTSAALNGAGLYQLSAGTLTLNTAAGVEYFNLSGSILGPGTLTVSNVMNWPQGQMQGSGRTVIAPGGLLNVGSGSGVSIDARTLENAGTVIWTGAGNFSINYGVLITNRVGALFEVQNNAAFNYLFGPLCRFDNAGTFRKTIGTGTTTFTSPWAINNYGVMEIRSGVLLANGDLTVASGALLNCTLGGPVAGTSYGQLQIGGTIVLDGALSVDLLPGFSPATNDSFTVVSAGTRSSTFASFSYPANRVTLQMSNTPTSVVLNVSDVFAVPQPILLNPVLTGTNALLTWTATSNVTYRLEFSPVMDSTNWTALPGDVTTLNNTASKFDTLTPSNRLYRVRVLP